MVSFGEAKSNARANKLKRSPNKNGEVFWRRAIQKIQDIYPDLKIVHDIGDKKPHGYKQWDVDRNIWVAHTTTDISDLACDVVSSIQETREAGHHRGASLQVP